MIVNLIAAHTIARNTSMTTNQLIKNNYRNAENNNKSNYADKKAAPTNSELYKSMYGVKEKVSEEEQAKFVKQLADVRAKYEMDVDDKNREIERNRNKTPEQEKKEAQEEKSFYEQYLEYKRKYE